MRKKKTPQELTEWTKNELREIKIDIDSVDLLFTVKWNCIETEAELYLAGRQSINNIPVYFKCHGCFLRSSGSDGDDSGCDSDFRWRENKHDNNNEHPRHKIFGDILLSKFPQKNFFEKLRWQ